MRALVKSVVPVAVRASPWGSVVKNPSNTGNVARAVGSIPGSGRSSGGGNGNPLQYSYLDSSMDRGNLWATVHLSQRIGHDLAIKQQPVVVGENAVMLHNLLGN